MNDVRLTEINREQQNNLRRILMLADLVKFAKERPGDDENIEMLNLSEEFVKSTKPMESETEKSIPENEA